MVVRIPENEAAERSQRIRLVVTDVDGVLTDAGVYYSEKGEEFKRFSLRDGMGIQRLRDHGMVTAIITGEYSLPVKRRAEKLLITELFMKTTDKLAAVTTLAAKHSLTMEEIAFMGDDLNDLDAMRQVGLSACPADAFPTIRESSHLVSDHPGGHGAFREFAEWILASRK
jgi:3-deoxy-D-manno-octulosonate 8-phosphate phosphatase (KDO 8-P phosphatase)